MGDMTYIRGRSDLYVWAKWPETWAKWPWAKWLVGEMTGYRFIIQVLTSESYLQAEWITVIEHLCTAGCNIVFLGWHILDWSVPYCLISILYRNSNDTGLQFTSMCSSLSGLFCSYGIFMYLFHAFIEGIVFTFYVNLDKYLTATVFSN